MTEKRPTLSRLRFETVGSITAIVVGIAALFVSLNEAHNAREQRYAAALPILMGGASSSGNANIVRFRVGFANAGAGTALIQSVSLRVDGELINSRDALQSQVLGEGLLIDEADYSIDQAEMRPLPAGEGVTAVELTWSRTDETAAAQSRLLEALSTGLLTVEACFCDIYDRCWTSRAGNFPVPIDACPAPTGFPIELIFEAEGADDE